MEFIRKLFVRRSPPQLAVCFTVEGHRDLFAKLGRMHDYVEMIAPVLIADDEADREGEEWKDR